MTDRTSIVTDEMVEAVVKSLERAPPGTDMLRAALEAVAPLILKDAAARLEATVPERTEDDEQVGFEKAIAAIRALSEDQP